MTTAGIVGGLGPESTIDYYRRILQVWAESRPGSAPSLLIHSLDVQRGIRLIESDLHGLTEYLLGSLRRLAAAGADFAVLAANSPHVVFDQLSANSPLPLLSIVEATVAEAGRRELARPALLGTRFTMEGSFYPATFSRAGIGLVVPNPEERALVHRRYMGELLAGTFRKETREEIVAIVARLRDEEKADSVILAGTELPLLLQSAEVAGLPVLDTTELHVAAIVARLARDH